MQGDEKEQSLKNRIVDRFHTVRVNFNKWVGKQVLSPIRYLSIFLLILSILYLVSFLSFYCSIGLAFWREPFSFGEAYPQIRFMRGIITPFYSPFFVILLFILIFYFDQELLGKGLSKAIQKQVNEGKRQPVERILKRHNRNVRISEFIIYVEMYCFFLWFFLSLSMYSNSQLVKELDMFLSNWIFADSQFYSLADNGIWGVSYYYILLLSPFFSTFFFILTLFTVPYSGLPSINPFTVLLEQERKGNDAWKWKDKIFEKVGNIVYSELLEQIKRVTLSKSADISDNFKIILLGIRGEYFEREEALKALKSLEKAYEKKNSIRLSKMLSRSINSSLFLNSLQMKELNLSSKLYKSYWERFFEKIGGQEKIILLILFEGFILYSFYSLGISKEIILLVVTSLPAFIAIFTFIKKPS